MNSPTVLTGPNILAAADAALAASKATEPGLRADPAVRELVRAAWLGGWTAALVWVHEQGITPGELDASDRSEAPVPAPEATP